MVEAALDRAYRPYSMHDVEVAASASAFTFISLFAGGGGSSIGYRLAGGTALGANEMATEAVRTYRLNFPAVPVDARDIRSITASDAEIAKFLGAAGSLSPGELDILDGSSPCTEFSTAGPGIAEPNTPRPYSDFVQENISTLTYDIFRIAAVARPKVVIVENVKGLSFINNRYMLDAFIADLQKRGYLAAWKVLIASNFGVPQKRERVFILGVRKDIADIVGISEESIESIFPTPGHRPVTIREALDDLKQAAVEVQPWFVSMAGSPLHAYVRRLPKCPEKNTRLAHVSPWETKHFTLTRTSYDCPAPTLVAIAQQPNGLSGLLHPEYDRKFTIPELKRLMALPDDYRLTGSLAQGAERICNMVPPLLTKAVADSVAQRVLIPYRTAIRR